MNKRDIINYLPVGSVVKIRFSKVDLMIIGFYTKDEEGKLYDYCAVEYPIGLYNMNNLIMFNNDVVKKVIHKGYETEEDKKFKSDLNDFETKKDNEIKNKDKFEIIDLY